MIMKRSLGNEIGPTDLDSVLVLLLIFSKVSQMIHVFFKRMLPPLKTPEQHQHPNLTYVTNVGGFFSFLARLTWLALLSLNDRLVHNNQKRLCVFISPRPHQRSRTALDSLLESLYPDKTRRFEDERQADTGRPDNQFPSQVQCESVDVSCFEITYNI